MFKRIQNIAISKNFLISLVFILLMFTSFGISLDDNYAIDVNGSSDEMEIGLDVEDKLENSQIDDNKISISQNSSNDILQASYTVTGGSFKKIQTAIDNAKSGDTIVLNGDFYSTGDKVEIRKPLTITSSSNTVLDGKDLSRIFQVYDGAKGLVIKNLKFINAFTEGRGGAIFISAKDVTIDNCVFENNHIKGSAGAVSTSYNATRAEGTKIQNCYFKANYATTGAGALGAYSNQSKVINCIFDSNYAKGENATYGGAIQVGMDLYAAYGSVINCTFKNNYAVTSSKTKDSHGGAGCVREGSSYIGCTFINNTAQRGGALTFHGKGTVLNCEFVNNTATTIYGGAISVDLLHEDMELGISDCIFEGNKAPLGGGIMANGMNIKINNCIFDKNHAFVDGGAININASTVTISDSDFTKNTADNDGGAVYILGQTTTIRNSNFINNSAIPDLNKLDDGLGGAIYINSTRATISNNIFNYNTARNGSAIYYDKYGKQLTLSGNTLFQNQAWVYALPIYASDIYYGETEKIGAIIHGGNNIGKYNNLAVSNAIYNAAPYNTIEIDTEHPISGATNSGKLYQDDREYNMDVLLTVTHEDGTVVYDRTLKSSYLGEVNDELTNLKPGVYYVKATHFEDTYYKPISNTTTFEVKPKVDNAVVKSTSKSDYNFDDVVVWTLKITNNGPNDSHNVVVSDVLPDGLIWIEDDTNGKYNPQTGKLTIDFLAVGNSVTVNIMTVVNKTGEIVNKVNVTADEFDVDLSNNLDQQVINVAAASDLEVKKSVNDTYPNYNDLVKWTVTVKNNGPDVAHDVKVSDILPNTLIWVSDDSSNKFNQHTGIWNVGTLNVGSEVKLNIVTRVKATGLIENDVTVSCREFDYDLSNNNDSEFIRVNNASDLAIVKIVNVTNVNLGDLVKWTLTVTNNGPNSATGVKVVDILPLDFIYVDSVAGKGSYSNGRFDIGNLAVGEKVVLEIISKVDGTGSFVNVANVTGNEYDYELSNNDDNQSIFVNPAADLEIIKLVNESNPKFGELVKWTLTVVNNGPDDAHDVVLSDILPNDLIWIKDNSSGKYNHRTGIWSIGELKDQQVISIEITTRVGSTKLIKNDASVKGREFDFNMSNNNDSEIVEPDKSSDLAIVKVVNVTSVNLGDLVKWTLTVTNNGPDVATGVKVSDVLPDAFEFVSANVKKGKYVNGIFEIDNLIVGESVSFDLISRVVATGSFINVANVTGNEYDYDLSNNVDNQSIFVNPASDLSVVKSVNETNPNLGELVKWTISVKNNGPDIAHDVKLADILPKSLVIVDVDGEYNQRDGVWNIGTLNVGGEIRLNVVTRVDATGLIENDVSVSAREFDYDLSNNNDSEIINVNKASDLAIVKVVNVTSVNLGDLVKWTLTVTNNGPDVATGVKVSDVLPDAFEFVSANVKKGKYVNGLFEVNSLDVGESVSFDLISRVVATGSFVNVANVTGNEYDYDLSNNVDNQSIFVNPASDLEVHKIANQSNLNYNDLVKWTISVKNNGPDVAHDVKVTDVLPKTLIWISDDSDYNPNNGIWNIGTLNVGNEVRLNIVTRVNATGVIQNNASVAGKEYDYNLTNNNDDEIILVNSSVDIFIVKTVNATNPNYLDIIKWTLKISNNGPDKATNVNIKEVLPEGLILISSNATKGFYEDGNWFGCCLEKGEVETLELVCKVNKTGTITNLVSISADEYDYDLSNNEDNESIDVPPAVDLEVVKEVDDGNPYIGRMVTWMISVTNHGPDVAHDVIVSDLLPDSLIYEGYLSSKGQFDGNNWFVGSLSVGNTEYINISCIPNELGIIVNEVRVNSSEYDWNIINNYDDSFIDVSPVADLSIIKLVNNSNPNYGELIRWTLIIKNNGPSDATGVILRDELPDGLELIESSEYDYENGVWEIGNMASGETRELELICKVSQTGEITNFATVYGNEYDPDLENNYGEQMVVVPPASDLSITKTVSKYHYYVGDIIRYSIRLTNNGPDMAENILVKDILDSSLSLKSFKLSSGNFNKNTKTWSIDSLDVDESVELIMDVVAKTEGIFENAVSVTSDTYDPDLSNNDDSVYVNVTEKPDVPDVVSKKHVDYKLNDDISKDKQLNKFNEDISKISATGNPIILLIGSLVFSLIYLGRNISKRR